MTKRARLRLEVCKVILLYPHQLFSMLGFSRPIRDRTRLPSVVDRNQTCLKTIQTKREKYLFSKRLWTMQNRLTQTSWARKEQLTQKKECQPELTGVLLALASGTSMSGNQQTGIFRTISWSLALSLSQTPQRLKRSSAKAYPPPHMSWESRQAWKIQQRIAIWSSYSP